MTRPMAALLAILLTLPALAAEPQPLTQTGDLSALMLTGMEKFLQAETTAALARRKVLWQRDPSSQAAYERSVEPNRARFREMIGAVDDRLPVRELEYISGTSTPAEIARNHFLHVHAVRWPVLDGVEGEGLLLQPRGEVRARVVALPDADQTPEMLAGRRPRGRGGWRRTVARSSSRC